jgi:hypothetical protein
MSNVGHTMDLLYAFIILALVATTLSLVLGLFVMGSGGNTDQMVSTTLMWARVGLQGFTFLLLIAALLLQSG